jgi:hypothetical protein
MEQQIGPHTLCIRGDLVELTLVNSVEAEHIEQVLGAIDRCAHEVAPRYVLANLRSLSRMSPAARRIASKWPGVRRFRNIAVVGASLIIQTMVTLVSRANTLLSGTTQSAVICFFRTEQEGRAWLERAQRES